MQCGAVCCSVLQYVAVFCKVLQCVATFCSVLQRVAVCCSILQYIAVYCSVLQRVAVCGRLLQCIAAHLKGSGASSSSPLPSLPAAWLCISLRSPTSEDDWREILKSQLAPELKFQVDRHTDRPYSCTATRWSVFVHCIKLHSPYCCTATSSIVHIGALQQAPSRWALR